MKLCSRCKVEKDLADFNRRSDRPGKLQPWCRSCQSERMAEWHKASHGTARTARLRENRAERKRIARAAILELLARTPCTDCGEDDPLVLEFDHVRGEKSYNIATMVCHGYSLEAVMAEVAKCEVICANCHRRRWKGALWGTDA
jgi:L-lysine 2,3-aminomutase